MEILDAYHYFDVLRRVNECDPDPEQRAEFETIMRQTPEYHEAQQSYGILQDHILDHNMSIEEVVVERALNKGIPFGQILQIGFTCYGAPIWELRRTGSRELIIPIRVSDLKADDALAKKAEIERWTMVREPIAGYHPITKGFEDHKH